MNNLFNQNDKKMFCFNKTAQKEKIEKTKTKLSRVNMISVNS